MKTITTQIIVEQEELFVINRRDRIVTRWCPACDAEAIMMAPETAAVVAGISGRDIYRLVETGQVHYHEDSVGLLRVCERSLRELPKAGGAAASTRFSQG